MTQKIQNRQKHNDTQPYAKTNRRIPVLHKRRLPLLLRLTRRAIVYFTLLLTALFIFFYMGNIQSFLDKDLNFILQCITCISIALFIFSLTGIIESIIYIFIYRHVFFAFYTAVFFVLSIISAVTSFAAKAIILISKGY